MRGNLRTTGGAVQHPVKALLLLQPQCPRCGVRHGPSWPHDLKANAGDARLDTPLVYEINRLAPPDPNSDGITDYGYDRLLQRWFGEGWELR